MSQDYAKRRKRSPKKSSVPVWVWLFTGAVVGAFIMFLSHLYELLPEAKELSQQSEAKPKTEKPSTEGEKKNEPRFDFYKLLLDSEVVVDNSSDSDDSKSSSSKAKNNSSAGANQSKPEASPAKAEVQYQYLLQVGSFRNKQDAEGVRAQMILMNLDSHIETVKVRDNETWHRVVVGPFATHGKVTSAQAMLIGENFETLVMKRKKEG